MGTVHAVLHRDVGTVLLLWTAAAARSVHVSGAGPGWVWHESRPGLSDRRHLCGQRLPGVFAGWMDSRSPPGIAARNHDRRGAHLVRPHLNWFLLVRS